MLRGNTKGEDDPAGCRAPPQLGPQWHELPRDHAGELGGRLRIFEDPELLKVVSAMPPTGVDKVSPQEGTRGVEGPMGIVRSDGAIRHGPAHSPTESAARLNLRGCAPLDIQPYQRGLRGPLEA